MQKKEEEQSSRKSLEEIEKESQEIQAKVEAMEYQMAIQREQKALEQDGLFRQVLLQRVIELNESLKGIGQNLTELGKLLEEKFNEGK